MIQSCCFCIACFILYITCILHPTRFPHRQMEKQESLSWQKERKSPGSLLSPSFASRPWEKHAPMQGWQPRARHPFWRGRQAERGIHRCLNFITRVSRQAEGKSAEERVSVWNVRGAAVSEVYGNGRKPNTASEGRRSTASSENLKAVRRAWGQGGACPPTHVQEGLGSVLPTSEWSCSGQTKPSVWVFTATRGWTRVPGSPRKCWFHGRTVGGGAGSMNPN